MKWLVAVLFFTLHSSLFTSCSDFLEIEPQELIVLDKYWDEEADVEAVIAGCYSKMQSQEVISRMMVWGEFRSDNIVGGKNFENDVQIANIFKENINASNTYAKWGDFYNIINRCNTIIKYAPQVAEKDPAYTQSKLNAHVAEAAALRDLMYFYLIRSFCNVPFTMEAYLDDNQDLELAATPFDEVLNKLIADLEEKQSWAVKRYPTSQTYYQRGRITQDAIHAMLCEMYLWKRDYANAVRYADMVIQAKKDEYKSSKKSLGSSMSLSGSDNLIDGFPLINDIATVGNMAGASFTDIFGLNNSSESIFELIYMKDDETMMANGAVSNFYGNASTFPGLVKPADFICTDINDGTFSVFLTEEDTRFYENFGKVDGQNNNYGIAKYVFSSASINLGKATLEGVHTTAYAEGKNRSNWIIYRLTDIMLLKAEALVEQAADGAVMVTTDGDLLYEAFKIVNAVNKRSNCSKTTKDIDATKYTTKSLMRELVLGERQRELMFEGKRWYDLVRRSQREGNTGFLSGTASRKGNGGGSGATSKLSRMEAIYWPYHIDELKVNSKLIQNPAFGSGENSSIVKN
ncbi:MAG: RagB/SusD family nutrient uptake outer membrane protein [Prevotella sp.]|nr:RagB/SusD family nutrient uptake outer membrane protein [Prevotella sp.]MBR4566727.1 RagB/SusD family nutrient uptake outer membrane protein [Prevotella sp.]